jgi:subtilisin family serine protease
MSFRRRAFCFVCAATLAALALAARSVAQAKGRHGAPRAAAVARPGAAVAPPGDAAASVDPLAGPPADAAIHPARLLVKLAPGATADGVASLHERFGATVLHDLPQIGWQVLVVPAGRNFELRERYAADPRIARADLDRGRKLAYVPNDPYWAYHWHLTNIKADLAWDTEKGSSSVVVAVMDTGLKTGHSDLTANVWTNPGEVAGNGIDDDLNGYVDDVHGYDFAYVDGDPDDVHGHGTLCAGVVAAVQDNSLGVTGVAPLCQVAGVKAALNSGYFYDSATVPAYLYCADMGFKVISMSFFSDGVSAAERDGIDYCWQNGVVLVAAAGNSLSVIPYYPGAYENVIAVAATDSANNPTWFTDYGSWVDVAAPGVGVATTSLGGYTTGFAGTSASTPHVAGLAALLWSANPAATATEIRAALEDTATPTIYAPWGEYTNYGKIDCDAAVDRVTGATSGGKAPRLLFVAPVGGDRTPDPTLAQRDPRNHVRFFGVGFERPNQVIAHAGMTRLPLFRQGRREVAAGRRGLRSPSGGTITPRFALDVNGAQVGAIEWDDGPGSTYAPTDCGTYGGTVTGGFFELYRADGDVLNCTQSGGTIYCELPVRKIAERQPTKITIDFTRAYANANGATETLWIYDWNSWSYPYGSWVQVWSKSITSSAMEQVSAAITVNPAHYLDDEGTLYLKLTTSGVASNGALDADALRVTVEE